MAHIQSVKDLKGSLHDTLDKIESAGEFAAYDQLNDFVDPNLFIPDVGVIKLPLGETTAQSLIEACHQSPFGKGEETIIDTTVRNTWELNVDQFQVQNPDWTNYINRITTCAISKLGLTNTNVKAEPYKLLIYEKGAMFKLHKDSEKAPGMFGTLVVSLPSAHQGGAVNLQHAKQSKVFRSDQYSASWACWYSDVSHEVTPIIDGYRFVLTFNLTADSTAIPTSASLNYVGRDTLHKLLADLRSFMASSSSRSEDKLIYRLEHQYTEHHLDFRSLKGKYLGIVYALQEACNATGFLCFLASCEKMVSGGCDGDEEDYEGYYDRNSSRYYDDEEEDEEEDEEYDENDDDNEKKQNEDPVKKAFKDHGYHAIIDECDSSLQLNRFVDMDGMLLAENIDIDENNFLMDDPFDDVPDEEEYEGFTGNEGVNATHFYRDTVIVLVPSTNVASLLMSGTDGNKSPYSDFGPYWSRTKPEPKYRAKELMQYFQALFEADPSNKSLADSLRSICQKVLLEQSKFSEAIIHQAIKLAGQMQDSTLLDQAVSSCQGNIPSSILETIGQHLGRVSLDHFRQLLTKPIASMKRLSERVTFLQTVASYLPGEDVGHYSQDMQAKKEWMASTIDEILDSSESLEADDAKAIFNLMNVNWSPRPLLDRLEGIIERNQGQTVFMISFLSGACPDGVGIRCGLPQDHATSLFQANFVQLYAQFDIPRSIRSPGKSEKPNTTVIPRSYWDYSRPPQVEESSLEAWSTVSGASVQVTSLIKEALRLGMEDQAKAFMRVIRQVAETYDVKYFKHFFLPLLQNLVPVWMENSSTLTDPTMESTNVYQAVLESYSKRYIGQRPPAQKDWSRKRVACSCKDCGILNAFVTSPMERVGRFAMGENRRRHLQQQLYGGDYAHDTERKGNPQTLIVTKTRTSWETEDRAWKARHAEATNEFVAFGLHTLREILGDRFQGITGMVNDEAGSVRHGKRQKTESGMNTGHIQRHYLAPSSHAHNVGMMPETGGAGTKRRIRSDDIIDLTGE